MSKFTPGPWKINSQYSSDARIEGANGEDVIFLINDGGCGDQECCGPT